MQKVSSRFAWSYVTPSSGGIVVTLTCKAADSNVKNKRSAKAGETHTFTPFHLHDDVRRIEDHMLSLTDDQLDSCFPREHTKKAKDGGDKASS
jgi:hypothetical protein